jgi:hypothetical protein
MIARLQARRPAANPGQVSRKGGVLWSIGRCTWQNEKKPVSENGLESIFQKKE